MALSDEVVKGRREGLIALRDHLAEQIDAGGRADLAALALRLTDVLRQLDELPADQGEAVNPLDELRKRRADRESGSGRKAGSGK